MLSDMVENMRGGYIMSKLPNYIGLFFDKSIVEKAPCGYTYKIIDNPHITFHFRPSEDEIPYELIGKSFTVKIVGFGLNEKAAGWRVELPEELKPFYKGQKNVHITTSVSEIGKPVDTGSIERWAPVPEFEITGEFNGFYA